jgi:16S rRNA (uracil1498-N3)-methyltransferase
MKLHRFIGDYSISDDKIFSREKELVHQIRSVLRMRDGDKVVLCDGKGEEATYLIKTEDKGLVFTKEGVSRTSWLPKNNTVLFVSVLKKENFELVVQKASELGISKIVPVISARTVKMGINMDRLKKIAKEASEQSGRGNVPEITDVVSFNEAILFAGKKIILDPKGDKGGSMDADAVFVGPEGGFTDEEISISRDCGAETVCLGKMTMRAETAAIVASYLFS